MSESQPERISDGYLADMVEMSSLYREPTLQNPRALYEAARQARVAAEDRGDPRVIEEADTRLTAILEAHPEFREQ